MLENIPPQLGCTAVVMPVRLRSNTEEWATPQDFFDVLDDEFGFTLDVCATPENAKCDKFFTKADDGLKQSWAGNVCWMNPPYGKQIPAWMEKAYRESCNGTKVVCLVPARTDTRWWHSFAEKGEKRFVKGRLKFMTGIGEAIRDKTASVIEGRHAPNNSAPFPSVIVIFG